MKLIPSDVSQEDFKSTITAFVQSRAASQALLQPESVLPVLSHKDLALEVLYLSRPLLYGTRMALFLV